MNLRDQRASAFHHQSHAVQHSEHLKYHIGHNMLSFHHQKVSVKSEVRKMIKYDQL